MFRRTPPPSPASRVVPDDSNEARFRALGYLLDAQRYSTHGLCILEVAGGFEVTGLKIPERGAAYDLVQYTTQITASEVVAAIEQSRALP